jgi:hypothetical protein
VFEEITLPLNSHLSRCPAFPQRDGLLDGISGRWKRKQGVYVIGHEKKNVREPNESLMAEFDSVEQGAGDFGTGQLSPPPVLAGYCNKIDFILGIDQRGTSCGKE